MVAEQGPRQSCFDPIAISGIGCRLPGNISNPSQLWDFLAKERSAACKLPESRFNIDSYHGEPDQPSTAKALGGYFLQQDVRNFDNQFFGINNREASAMDPQQRNLLEVVFESLESAGVTLEDVSGANVGCYVASFTTDYITMQTKDVENLSRFSLSGMGTTILANRISHAFNLKGPSCVIDTACSSSLYVLHAACAALQAGECDSAIVAGVNIVQAPELHVAMSQAGVLSPTSTCHTFDASADGYGRADGINAIYIKRLDDAVRDGDPVRTVIRSTAVNSNGRTPGLMQPAIDGQEAVIRKAYARAQLQPSETSYVETHGTGTSVGDPIEVEALSRVFSRDQRQSSTLIGSVKTNLGHGEAASGLTSIIKAVLALEQGKIPATVGLKQLNPKIKAEEWGVEVVTGLTPLPATQLPHRISVNSFGYGGANAHGIFEATNLGGHGTSTKQLQTHENGTNGSLETVRVNGHTRVNGDTQTNGRNHVNGIASTNGHSRSNGSSHANGNVTINGNGAINGSTYTNGEAWTNETVHVNGDAAELRSSTVEEARLLPLSAHKLPSLHRRVESLRTLDLSSVSMADLTYTLGQRRSHLPVKGYVLARPASFSDDVSTDNLRVAPKDDDIDLSDSKFAFVFTGQGAQWAGMARDLMQFPTFAKTIHKLDQDLASLPVEHTPKWKIQDVLLDTSEASPINQAEFAQPVTTAVQIAVVNLLQEWSILPRGTVGHSSGEIGAAYAAGLLSSREAIFIAYYRGFVVSQATRVGAMAAVGLGPNATSDWIAKLGLGEQTKVACINSPQSVTISGDSDGIDAIHAALKAEGIFIRQLKTNGKAYHSHHMAAIGERYAELLNPLWISEDSASRPNNGLVSARMSSTVTCLEVAEKQVRSSSYWRKNLESPVRFSEGLGELMQMVEGATLIEIGPHAALKMPITQTLGKKTPYFATLNRGKDSAVSLLSLLGDLYNRGFSVDFQALNKSYADQGLGVKVLCDLPTYPWHYEDLLWHESRVSQEGRSRRHPRHELLGSEVVGGSTTTHSWRNQLQLDSVPWLRDHKLGETTVFPAAAYMAMAVEALLQTLPPAAEVDAKAVVIRQVDLLKALPLNEDEPIELYTELKPLALSNVNNSTVWWEFQITSVSEGVSVVHSKGSVGFDSRLPAATDLPSLPAGARMEPQSKRLWYESFDKAGLAFGPAFQLMDEIYTSDPRGEMYSESNTKTLCPEVEGAQSKPRYLVHPTLLDSLFQAGLVAGTGGFVNAMVDKVPTKIGHARINLLALDSGAGAIRSTSKVIGFSSSRLNSALFNDQKQLLVHFNDIDMTIFGGNDTAEMRHPLFRVNWKPDLDKITTNDSLTLALDRTLSITDLGLLGTKSYMLAALELAVHKNPDTNILCLSSDHLLVTLAMIEVLEAKMQFRRFNTFSLGRFAEDGQFEVSELRNFTTPLGLDSLVYRKASSTDQYELVILSEDLAAIEKLGESTSNDTLFLRSPVSDSSHDATVADISVTSSSKSELGSVDIIRKDSSVVVPEPLSCKSIIHVCGSPAHPVDIALKDQLGNALKGSVEQIALTSLTASSIPEDALVVSTVELEKAVFANADDIEFDAIKQIIGQAARIVWITGSGVHHGFDPTLSLFPGLARAIMIEQPATKVFSLELDPLTDAATMANDVAAIVDQTRAAFPDYEYIKDTTGLLVSRTAPDERMNEEFRGRQDGTATMRPLAKAGTASLSLQKAGQLNTAQFVQQPHYSSIPLAADNVVVKVAYLGLNAKDVYALAGRVHTTNATCSLECTGEVMASGSSVQDLAVGDKVAVLCPGHFSTYETVPSWTCVKLNNGEDMREMASVLVVFVTAIYALYHRANLQQGESILVHSAAGGVGIATIQIAKLIGAEIFATVGTDEKKKYLVDNFGLREDHIFNSRDTNFTTAVTAATDGRGVDVILNSLTGELLHDSWDCLAEFGRFVEIGKRDIADAGRLDMSKLARSTTFTAFDLSLLIESKSPAHHRLLQKMLSQAMELLRDGSVQPPRPLTIFNVSDVASAFNHFNSTKRMGKIVISFENQAQLVPVVPLKYSTVLDPNKSYLLVGCLGGLGRSVSKWMLSRGARQFVFIGRSGTQKPAAKRLVDDLEREGAHCTIITGNVVNYDDVERAVRAAPTPLGGVVQAAMGLNEAIFKYMPREYWISGTEAKVQGTWNLHNALAKLDMEKQLDFFAMTSSISGKVGTATESNYCAANNFLDVFSRYRRSLGLTAISLGLGMISEVGYLHENPHIEDLLLRKGIRPITEDEVLQIFDLGLSSAPTSAASNDLLAHPHLLSGLELTGLQSHHKQGYGGYWQFLDDARFSVLTCSLKRSSAVEATQGAGSQSSAISEAVASRDEEALVATVKDVVAKKMSNLILLPMAKLDVKTPLSDFGMDSMLAAELRQYIFGATGADVLFLTIMDKKVNILSLAKIIAEKLLG